MERTYATLCIYSASLVPSEISGIMGKSPSREAKIDGGRVKKNGWFLSSRDECDSDDLSEHIMLVMNGVESSLKVLFSKGCDAVVYGFWSSSEENGGVTLSKSAIKKLADSGLEFYLDIWSAKN